MSLVSCTLGKRQRRCCLVVAVPVQAEAERLKNSGTMVRVFRPIPPPFSAHLACVVVPQRRVDTEEVATQTEEGNGDDKLQAAEGEGDDGDNDTVATSATSKRKKKVDYGTWPLETALRTIHRLYAVCALPHYT